jgi:NADH-quinone oxidoreductase subunit M
MEFIYEHLLSLILFMPVLSAVILMFIAGDQEKLIRWLTFVLSLFPLALSIYLWVNFDPDMPGFQYQELYTWNSTINASYHVGVDGISLPLVLLTTILTPLAIMASFTIKDRVKTYMILFLLLEMGMLGVFLQLDLLLFFVFWEFGLVPMYFLINQWGSEKGTRTIFGKTLSARNYASLKFILYTMLGSLGLLLAIQMIGLVMGTFDMLVLFEKWPSLHGTLFGLPVSTVKAIAFWAFLIAFAVKVPVWPFHTWLPDAHTEAPTAGSMILAGVLLKLGCYGFLRLVLPLYPEESYRFAPVLGFLAVMGIIWGALSAYGQKDFKRLVAYSSVNHMGFVVLGIAGAMYASGSQHATIALEGAILGMFNHGITAAAMFFLVGVLYERTHTRDLTQYGGLFPLIPVYGAILIFTSLASLGLPGLNGFISESLVVLGIWPIFTVYTALAMIGLFFTGAYVLKSIKHVLHGPMNEKWVGRLSEIKSREVFIIAPLMVLMLWLGIWPKWILEVINKAVMMFF